MEAGGEAPGDEGVENDLAGGEGSKWSFDSVRSGVRNVHHQPRDFYPLRVLHHRIEGCRALRYLRLSVQAWNRAQGPGDAAEGVSVGRWRPCPLRQHSRGQAHRDENTVWSIVDQTNVARDLQRCSPRRRLVKAGCI